MSSEVEPDQRRGWLLADHRIGMQVHVHGVADALKLNSRFVKVEPKSPWTYLAPWLGPAPAERAGRPTSPFQPPWPHFVIASGRQAIPYLKSIRATAGPRTYAIVLQDPRSGPMTADLIWVPQHDRLRAANVITTITAPHRYSADRLARLRANEPEWLSGMPRPWIAVMIGGPNKIYRYDNEDIKRLTDSLQGLFRHAGTILLSMSRRTPERLANAIEQASAHTPRRIWTGAVPDEPTDETLEENPYPQFLAHADRFVVTGDSVNMCGEACATGRPVWTFIPSGEPSKFDRFHTALQAHGATRPLPTEMTDLADWTYEPLHAAEAIAAEVEKRWAARQRNLPSPRPSG